MIYSNVVIPLNFNHIWNKSRFVEAINNTKLTNAMTKTKVQIPMIALKEYALCIELSSHLPSTIKIMKDDIQITIFNIANITTKRRAEKNDQ